MARMRSLSFQRTIGAGAFGTVYLAELSSGQGFRRQVAVKVLHRKAGDDEMLLTRIRDEARLLGLLQDDAILKVLDMVQVDGLDAVVMEYVEGIDLETLVERGEGPPPRALAELGAAVAAGLARAHGARHPATGRPLNVIHRDVKPANIMITSSGGVKLLDFGVARARFDARESHTGQLVLGTLNYIAPEYIVTGEVSPAADVYGLGLVVWQTATGEAFGQPKIREDAHERRLAERLQLLASSHAALVPAVRRMLAWNPTERPSADGAEQLLQECADALGGPPLRTWARRTVLAALAARTSAEDNLGLVGRTITLSGGALVDDSPPAAPAPSPAAPGPAAAATAAPPPADGGGLLRPVLMGLFIGGLFGLLVAGLGIAALLIRG
jgi:serine/threonine-protein kinase